MNTTTQIADGIHEDLAAEIYHADPALGSGSIKALLESPKLYHWNATHPRGTTRAMDVGSLIDAILLEPDALDLFIPLPDSVSMNFGTDAFQEWYRWTMGWNSCVEWAVLEGKPHFEAHYAADPRTIVRASDWARANNAADAVKADPVASALLSGRTQVAAFHTDEHGARSKARLDALPDEGEIVYRGEAVDLRNVAVDLKSTGKRAHSMEYSTHALRRMGYFLQAAHYRRTLRGAGEDREYFALVVVEQSPPHHVGVFMFDDETMDMGEQLSRRACRDWATCTEMGEWPGYGEGIKTIGLSPDDLDRENERSEREVLIDVI